MLLITPKPFHGESLFSFLSRAAHRNFLPSIRSLFPVEKQFSEVYKQNLNLTKYPNVQVLEMVRQVGEMKLDMSKMTVDQFVDVLCGTNPTEHDLNKKFCKGRVKFCPACMSENHYHRTIWDVTVVTACLKHQCHLQENCPTCSRVLRLFDLMNEKCKCGTQLSFDQYNLEKPSDFELAAQSAIQSLLEGTQKNVINSSGREIDARNFFMMLDSFSWVLDGFGTHLSVFDERSTYLPDVNYFMCRPHRSNNNSTCRDLKMITTITTAAYRLIVHPEQPIYDEIFRMLELKDLRRGVVYGKLKKMRSIFEGEHGTYYRSFWETYTDQIEKTISPKERISHSRTLGDYDQNTMSLNEVISFLRLSRKVITRMVIFGTLRYKKHNGYFLFDSKEIESFQHDIQNCLDKYKLARFFGISRVTVNSILDRGWLEITHGPEIDGYPILLVHSNDLQIFKYKLIHLVKEEHPTVSRWISMQQARNYCARNGVSVAQLLSSIIEKHVRVSIFRENLETLNDLFVSSIDVLNLVNGLIPAG